MIAFRSVLRITVCAAWMLAAIYLIIFELTSLVPSIFKRPFIAGWITVAILCVFVSCAGFGAILGFFNRAVGTILLRIAAGFMLIYFISYFLLGGLDDAPNYLPYLIVFAAISGITFWLRMGDSKAGVG